MPERVRVGPFGVDDLSANDIVGAAVDFGALRQKARFYALHVGGLNHRADLDFVDEMNSAELVCADGGSVLALARLAGASDIERAPTTDVGWDVLRGLTARLNRPPRVALVGGEPGLADRAATVLADAGVADVVRSEHGFHQDWEDVLRNIQDTDPEVCIVGMGAPREMRWVRDHLEALPPALIITCGGWFGFLVGQESRAPTILRRPGLEWIARIAQSPLRLGPRYILGAWSTACIALGILASRWSTTRGRPAAAEGEPPVLCSRQVT